MALERKDRVKDQSATTGTGTLTLDGIAPTGYRTLTAAHTTGATVRYTILLSDLTEWEVGEGVWTTSGATLTRVTVFASSNSDALVDFSAGDKIVFTGPVADDVSLDVSTAIPTNGWYRPSADLIRTPNSVTVDDTLIISGGAGAASLTLPDTGRLYIDGGVDTYLFQSAANVANITVGGVNKFYVNTHGIGVGGAAGTATGFFLTQTLTGTTTGYGILNSTTFDTTVTANVYGNRTNITLDASAYSLTSLYHYSARLATKGGATVTAQYGFIVESTVVGATSNFAFHGNLAVSGTANWNVYIAGTAPNYLASNLVIGGTAFDSTGVAVLTMTNSTAPAGGTANTVAFYSTDDAAGHTIPSFYCEGTNVVATGQADTTSSVRVKMRIQGTVYTFLCI